MAKCVDCAWFPWEPGADVSMLPAVRCSPKLAVRRWTPAGVSAEHNCPEFRPKESQPAAEEVPRLETKPEPNEGEAQKPAKVVTQDDTDGRTKDATKKAPKRADTRRRK